MDPGGFDFTAFGRNMIADPGRFTYNEISERRLFKSAFSHTTLTVNGKEPFEYISSWNYGRQGNGMVTELSLENILHPEIYRISSEQTFEKYCHRRVLITGFSEKQPFLAMIDQVNGLGKGDQVELHFQINYTKVRLDGQTTVSYTHLNDMTWTDYDALARKVTDITPGNEVYGTHYHTWRSCVECLGLTDGKQLSLIHI